MSVAPSTARSIEFALATLQSILGAVKAYPRVLVLLLGIPFVVVILIAFLPRSLLRPRFRKMLGPIGVTAMVMSISTFLLSHVFVWYVDIFPDSVTVEEEARQVMLDKYVKYESTFNLWYSTRDIGLSLWCAQFIESACMLLGIGFAVIAFLAAYYRKSDA